MGGFVGGGVPGEGGAGWSRVEKWFFMYMDTIKTQLNIGWVRGGRVTWRRWSRLEQGGEVVFHVYGHNIDSIKYWVGLWGEGYLEKVEQTGAGWRSGFYCILIQ